MKTIHKILYGTFLILFLSSCLGENKEVINDAKQELGIVQKEVEEVEVKKTPDLEIQASEIKDQKIEEKKPKFEIIKLTQDQFLEFDDLSEVDFLSGEIEVTGKTIETVDKIKVNFTNENSDFPDDSYLLTQFKSGDDIFLYRALSRYETLDFGENKYVFFAYSGDKVSKTELIIHVEKEEEKKEIEGEIVDVEKIDEIVVADLPVSTDSGYPIQIGDNKLTYSGIKGLEISKKGKSDLTCENITEFLQDSLGTWFYWNTCRDIEKDAGLSYFVLRLDGEKYIYEKHYIIFKDLSYGVYELEMGTGVTKDNIAEKNTELKEKNADYPTLDIVDKLFIDVSK
ncbi:hypothetical protein A9Q91_00325 [Candidatus Gracilibacteria bacterium 28_42_T64]|nr:hypothetical protein A9Q91_00325 [Candidatus Gracilibacteria bacterium 28_42_T64]